MLYETNEFSLVKKVGGAKHMGKKAVIVVHLVEESTEEPNEKIEKEIFDEISKSMPRIPWCNRVEKVTVTNT